VALYWRQGNAPSESEGFEAMSADCLFCRIASGEVPSTPVYSDEEFYAFRDIHPAAPTHILLIPRKHIPRVLDATEADAELLGRLLLRANAIAEQEGIAAEGVRYVFNNNAGVGQTIYHIHLHILGGRPMGWPPG
jgi:histidine triad (HIT) family protein